MNIYYILLFFAFGTILGSFYNVVGDRIPLKESIIKPPSHCDNCKHQLKAKDLVPIFSYIFNGGKCPYCKTKITPFYPLFETLSGVLFALTYMSFGLSLSLIVALTFISLLLILLVSDFKYMIMPDSILIIFGIIIAIEIILIYGLKLFLIRLLGAFISAIIMFGIKKLGDFLFKKESMGGGDIKLLFIFGLTLGYEMAIFSVFLGSLIGLPVSIILAKNKEKNKNNEIPFGPYLSIGAIIILLLQLDLTTIINILTK